MWEALHICEFVESVLPVSEILKLLPVSYIFSYNNRQKQPKHFSGGKIYGYCQNGNR